MPPQQSQSGMTPVAPSGQYDFIVNGSNRPSESWLVHAPLKTRILVVGGGALVLLLVAWIVIALLSASGGTSARNLLAIAQEEAELVRISDGPAHNASLETTQNLASSTQLSVLSDEQSIITYLGTVNAAPTTTDLVKNRNTRTDSQLLAAKADGTYDQVYISIAQHQLTVYSQNLKRTFDATGNTTERQLLSAAYHHAQLLLTLSKQH
ncbi:MAG TPA: hypothetical protein VLF64_03040 [Candidatus Saccharimonadales bacterium]|nr:hypothetical protein [Candidatus Saccharimonadales bacterium]